MTIYRLYLFINLPYWIVSRRHCCSRLQKFTTSFLFIVALITTPFHNENTNTSYYYFILKWNIVQTKLYINIHSICFVWKDSISNLFTYTGNVRVCLLQWLFAYTFKFNLYLNHTYLTYYILFIFWIFILHVKCSYTMIELDALQMCLHVQLKDARTCAFLQKYFFSVRLLSVMRGHSVFSSPPQRPMTSDFEGFSIPDFILFPILILQKEPVFPF